MEITNLREPGSRIRNYRIAPEVLPHLFAENTYTEITRGIPDGSKLRGFAICPETNSISIFIENDVFELIESGTEAPVYSLQGRRIRGKELEVVKKMIAAQDGNTPQQSMMIRSY